jgi:hypothetical protein
MRLSRVKFKGICYRRIVSNMQDVLDQEDKTGVRRFINFSKSMMVYSMDKGLL